MPVVLIEEVLDEAEELIEEETLESTTSPPCIGVSTRSSGNSLGTDGVLGLTGTLGEEESGF